ncbi:uncharacterized protein LOC143546762 [Bidens hawaiensis]|uniref:uncharacterized protein LOC143546762 n=1 Tax=Bidens hawaiensis TaxID=980011 RepID=UPI00404B9FBD
MDNSWNFIPYSLSIPGPWRSIGKLDSDLDPMGLSMRSDLRSVVGNGVTLLFWSDIWVGEEAFQVRFPGLYLLENNKTCQVSDRLVMYDGEICGVWDWIVNPISADEIEELRNLLRICEGIHLSNEGHKVCWSLNDNGIFSVKSIKVKVEEIRYPSPLNTFTWNNWVPKKVCILAWRASLERLPTLVALAKRNICYGSVLCPICGEVKETLEHMFNSCRFAQDVRQVISMWYGAHSVFAFCIQDLLDLFKYSGFTSSKKKAFHAVCLITMWSIWKLRNDVVFNGKPSQLARVVGEIKSLSFLWIKNRSKKLNISWEDWTRFHL